MAGRRTGKDRMRKRFYDLIREDNEAVQEREQLAAGRIREIAEQEHFPGNETRGSLFRRTAELLLMAEQIADRTASGEIETMPEAELAEWNRRLYEDILPENYDVSMANPDYTQKVFGEELGKEMAFFAAEMRSAIPYAFENRRMDLTILMELFIEVCNSVMDPESGITDEKRISNVRNIFYYFEFDYCDRFVPERLRETLDPDADFAKKIIMESDLNDLSYLYRFGEYVSETEIETAKYLNSLPEEKVRRMADYWSDGFARGFEVSHRSFKEKKTVMLRWHLGFERIVRYAVENFRALGLEPIIPRASFGSMNRAASGTNGFYGTPANRQYMYDHRSDDAEWLDKAVKERKLEVMRGAYEELKDLAAVYAGPAVMETFGEDGFDPVIKESAWTYSERQKKLRTRSASEVRMLQNQFIPEETTSFTIIAWPIPEIGKDRGGLEFYSRVFDETIAINTLNHELYRGVQQKIIDCLDEASYVLVKGKDGNETDLRIELHPLADRKTQSGFENCLADVNIPLGEVFTSPVLKGTSGLLHVGKVYIDEFQFRDLRIRVEDGKAVEYSCGNFETEKEGHDLVERVIMKDHDVLPMGEFAIGTNTTAYAVSVKYGIEDKFPILIAEKTGPHFAFGDTCYSYMEDVKVLNPDGREMIAKDNEISSLRTSEPEKAYFGCHTDITLPYPELGLLTAVRADGTKTDILRDGRFVLPGTELLNEALDQLK
ncbi:Leucyl aminopeptidase (aminopeptidase T) [[Clostridium] aminophilum]|uniref:Leucyl aminopeptidase (Aminopeptidase T) n=2 Tax=[Clostridium] aminophilum TaxID=1526 RepID=A0A1I6KCY4_9FIRM|nr:Leucyl aminopeptidase (aminopeptidase T) [[Clostridium] aminophilum]